MNEDIPAESVVHDVIVDIGNGAHLTIEKGLSRAAAQVASKRVSKFFLGVGVVERPRRGRPRGRSPDVTSE
jgi:hypothetical protein